jgi:hypothetical protein
MSTVNDPTYPKTRDARRRAYKNLVAELARPTPAETIAAVRFQLDCCNHTVGNGRRSDPPEKGMFIPSYALNAMAQTLAEVERDLARMQRQAAQRVAA